MLMNMIDYIRISFYALLIVLIVLLFQAWDKDHPKLMPDTQSKIQTTNLTTNYIPETTSAPSVETSIAQKSSVVNQPTLGSSNLIQVKTDVQDVVIDAHGGNIISIKLNKYPEEFHSKQPFTLLNDKPNNQYLAQSGLLSTQGPDTSQGQALYSYEKSNYVLQNGQQVLQVVLNWKNPEGLTIKKIFTFNRGKYEIDVAYQIVNQSKQPWQGSMYLQLLRANTPPPGSQGFMNLTTFFGAAISTPDKPFQKISFKEMTEKNLSQTVVGGWAAMIQHYFISAWVPDNKITSQYYSRVTNDGLYTIGMISEKKTVNPGENFETKAKFYGGPAITEQLKQVAPGLQLTIDYGWLWFISGIIFWMMQLIYNVVGNWGWAIVLVTIIIKLLFYQLSAKSYRSMSGMKKLQPRINALKERFGEDKQKFTQAVMELYKKEKVNPMSGCLPILIQIPVFIALYWVLIESVELRQAPFMLWIQDLSTKDPYYILPILMGLSMFLQQRLNPPPPDPMQAKVLMFMPILFTAMFINFPAGLMLYWFVNNTLSFLQQWYIMRTLEKTETKKVKN